ncbi:biotin--[acetyl-CoA-carboxylase] ligase [Sphingobacterium psychroaquaticum]|uniref:BirA family transcriptional regulator, biotin operon repressor / biotin-[acetyl-CoA-carboxylase] ligase n=1 Tax=Sphingobacterium psychroaquaticum TaxID=561061 RepID=A0A1X7KIR5_9SPHI|nr:biotin--[acetyl-CoA-carboxylase] ligase [Sphingobacterium psychroaquaticum]SMG41265.1 BirA family transcriptional regulator, biotin operon repressor / biotin-[acetyl-CoA-carboxylase] ligase [Sphingobacterium psychroaquaticum]
MQNNTFSRLYLRQNLIVLDQVTSTNDYLKQLLSNITPSPQGTAIMAIHQTQGKGQRGSQWITQAGKNLTFSFALFPQNLPATAAFNINMMVSLAIHKYLHKSVEQVKVKWPNDIYINNKKVGGVLIENQLSGRNIKSSVIGIGINVNQANFSEDINHKATSLARETGLPRELQDTCLDILETFFDIYASVNVADTDLLLQQYNELLYQKDMEAQYEIQGQRKTGTIRRVTDNGLLLLEMDGEERSFDLKEISFIPPTNL